MAELAKILFSAIFNILLSLVFAEIAIVDNSKTLLFVSQCSVPNENARFDCMPDNKMESDCKARGCCWDPGAASKVVEWQQFKAGNITRVKKVYTVPKCYFPVGYDGYTVVNTTKTSFGLTILLKRTSLTSWPKDVMNLQLDVYLETKTRVRFKIFDPAVARYEVPVKFNKVSGEKPVLTDYTVTIWKSPFGISITRTSTGAILFDSTVAPLIFADQFIQLSTHTGTGLIYGLGDHKGPLLLKPVWGQYAFWNSDHKMPLQSNLYGTQPFFLSLEEDGSAHGVLLVNSNAMEAITQPLPALTFRTIGGILDFYVFTGPSPNTVIQQYTDLIGQPFLPPYWALGYHLCRWGYRTEAELLGIIKRNLALEIPYEVQWNDIDYAVNRMDWTLNNDTYGHLPNIVHELHNIGMKYMMIVDVAIAAQPPVSYPPFDEGIQQGIFVRNASGQPLIGKVWPGPTVFPDWSHPNVVDWWSRQVQRYHDIVPFDGIWADMNEPSNFVAGSVDGCTNNTLDVPPYLPDLIEGALPEETICPSGQHQLTSHYNLHNTYGHLELVATNKALRSVLGKRSIIISRSTFISSGHWAGHWTGDNEASYDDLYYSIPAILSYNMFGIPLVGADICGFLKNTVEQLCVRWHQLGAFYPFMRNHNDPNNIPQDPGAFSPQAQQIIKRALELRYSLLPYLYTLFVRSYQTGSTVARPLFFEFILDENTYDIDKQFLWGSALLISPALEKDQTVVDAYLPRGVWYDIYNGTGIRSNGSMFSLDSPLEKINVHARGGHIIPLQQPAVTTTRARKNPFQLLVALDQRSKTAEGELIWDDGESLYSIEQNVFSEIRFNANTLVMTSTIVKAGYAGETGMMLEGVWVLGLHKNESFHVLVNDQKVPFDYNADNQELYVRDFLVDLLQPLTIRW